MRAALLEHAEDIIEPALPIVDPHHHIWTAAHGKYEYMMPELLSDAHSGHTVTQTVYCECKQAFRQDGPAELRPVGETEFVMAAVRAAGPAADGLCAGLVMHTDMLLGSGAAAVLEAHRAAAGNRLKGIRHIVAHDPSPLVRSFAPAGLLAAPQFRDGVRTLAAHGLVFETFIFHGQLGELAALADACPKAVIVLDAFGGPLGIGPHKGRRAEVFAAWRRDMAELGRRPNMRVQIGGFGARMLGFGFHAHDTPPSTETFAAAWEPYMTACLESFGPARCMLTSNFPEDGSSISYRQLWNVFKHLCRSFSTDEKAMLFSRTATQTYAL